MFLKYVELQGFKSFPDKTRIKFDRVLTGVVGPNGSGKSNISDAVRWVLGEQSTKNLRGGKMEDVIFGGTLTTRKPMGFAQVSLCLDNSDGRIQDMGEQILVTRRYYRSGDSEYSINGAPVRLRDLREMFMDTGLGRDGYSIIGQGKIAEVVDSRPMDRREVFEEASGIAKYRFRKNEAEKKLSTTQDNLERLRDIAGELEGRLEPLKEQSEKAKKFLALSDERKGLEITLYTDTIKRSKESLKNQQEKIDIAKLDYTSVVDKMSALDSEIESIQSGSRSEDALSQQYAQAMEERNNRIAELESSAAVLKNDIMHAEREIRSIQDDMESMSKDDTDLKADIDSRLLLSEQKKAAASALEQSIASLESELSELIEEGAETDKRRSETASKLSDIDTKINELKTGIAAASSSLEASAERKNAVLEALEKQNGMIREREEELEKVSSYCEKLDEDFKSRENEQNGYRLKLDSRQEKLDALKDKLDTADSTVSSYRQKINVLQDMERSMEGYFPPVKKVLEAANRHELSGVLGTVSSLFTVNSGMELAIETALGNSMQNVVTENERYAREGMDYLKKNRIGKATFMPLDTVKPSSFGYRERLRDDGVIGLASELITCDEKYRDIADYLLGRIIVAEDMDYAARIARKADYKVRIVTKDGQQVNAGGTYTGGYVTRQGGSFSRKGEIDKLEQEIEKILSSTGDEREKLAAAAKEVEELSATLEAISSEMTVLREDGIRASGEKNRLEREITAIKDNNALGEAELGRLEENSTAKKNEIASSTGTMEVLIDEKNRLEEILELEDNPDGFMERRTSLMDTISARRVSLTELTKEAESIDSFVSELRQRGEKSLERVSEMENEVKRISAENEQRKEQLENMAAETENLRENAESLRVRMKECSDKKLENEETVDRLRQEKDSLTEDREKAAGEIARLDERKLSLENDYSSSVTRLWEEYELTPAEAAPLCVEYSGVTELKSQVASVRAKIRALGNVNVEAIDEYTEVKSRYEFMSTQIDDVDSSRKQLLSLIDKLETEMKQIFTVSFNDINTRFHSTFTDLFGGGSANLYLSDENDILGSGIELDVQPPGKVIKNLSALSGGEKALVAIAIYMAILEVNPSPFCILDEIDSALDESNVVRFANYLKRMTDNTQMITITHRRGTMEAADILYGVTMQEEGVSMVLRLSVDEAEVLIAGEKS